MYQYADTYMPVCGHIYTSMRTDICVPKSSSARPLVCGHIYQYADIYISVCGHIYQYADTYNSMQTHIYHQYADTYVSLRTQIYQHADT